MNLLQKLSLLCFSASLPFCAQAQYIAAKIVFKHPGEATQAQLEQVSGFHHGLAFSTRDLTDAAQRIANTSFYDNVGATLDGTSVHAVTVNFDLKPSPTEDFLPTGFENLVWLTPEEAATAIRSKVPLYNGKLLEAGTMADDAADALAAALAAKGIPGAKVEHATEEPTLTHPMRAMEFRVLLPTVSVGNIKLNGVDPSLAPLLQKSVNATAHTLLNTGLSGALTTERILAPLLDAGYAQAKIENVSIETVPLADNKEPVVLHGQLNPGDIWKIGAITFEGTQLYSADDFAKNLRIKPGDTYNRKLLADSLAPLDAAYRNKGYIDVFVKAEPKYDAAAKTVSYTISVVPGEPYRLHEVTTTGLDQDPAAKADFTRGFAIKPGDIYNPVYVSGFIKENTALQALSGYTGAYKAYAYPSTHTVDLVLTFLGRKTQVNVR